MSLLSVLFSKGPISRVRRNHALEHATLAVLARQMPGLMLAGYSDFRGFWVVGHVATQDLQQAVDEALARLRGGESHLAIHPNCGTNFAAAGLAAGSAAWLAMLGGPGRTVRAKLERWSLVVALSTLALILAQPLGPYLQARVTTQAQPGNIKIVGIMRYQRKKIPLHHVITSG